MSVLPFKVVLLGEGRVGKTCITVRYVKNAFNDQQESTIQATYLDRRLNVGKQSVKLMIWDTAGQERFHALGPIYYRDAQGALLVYDITDRDSFTKVRHWVKELRKSG
jgi:Ras-related protein Rab-21